MGDRSDLRLTPPLLRALDQVLEAAEDDLYVAMSEFGRFPEDERQDKALRRWRRLIERRLADAAKER